MTEPPIMVKLDCIITVNRAGNTCYVFSEQNFQGYKLKAYTKRTPQK